MWHSSIRAFGIDVYFDFDFAVVHLSVNLVNRLFCLSFCFRLCSAGDFAYNFDRRGGETGDAFMANIEQLAARVPYMVSHGKICAQVLQCKISQIPNARLSTLLSGV